MKTIKTSIFVLFLVFVCQTALAEIGYFKGDTIRYKFDKMLIEYSATNAIHESYNSFSFLKERVAQIHQVLDEMAIEKPANDEMITISFNDQEGNQRDWNFKEIKLSRTEKTTKGLVVFEDGTVFEKDFGHYCICFSYLKADMKIFVDDLADLTFFASEQFNQKIEQGNEYLDNHAKNKNKLAVLAFIDLRGDEAKGYLQDRASLSYDQLELKAGVGSAWVKNTFVSGFTFKASLNFSKKGLQKNEFFAEWDLLYDFSDSNGNDFFKVNHFLSVGWDHNFSRARDEDSWYGFSIGYLVKRNNDFFKDNTFRISVNKRINDTFDLSPQIYFNDFFKNVYPGIRVGISF